ncbi:MAG: hypothetical protein KA152_02340 [Verrucomicrobiales bacterium]|nr:hypothetical protein [Verrucomicrobiales bacterium]HQW28074.1 hypothetical protein [Verrucomicrobiales bacterium]
MARRLIASPAEGNGNRSTWRDLTKLSVINEIAAASNGSQREMPDPRGGRH